jgi:DNA-binding transcriptional regulator YiaG
VDSHNGIEEISMTLPELIEKTGLSDAEIAVKTMCKTTRSVYRWRRGQVTPSRANQKLLCLIARVNHGDVEWEATGDSNGRP